jgi:chromosome segregation ATPase
LITFAWVSSLETARIQSNSQLVEEFLELKNLIKAPQPSVQSLVAEIVSSAENTSSYKADFATITDNCKTLLDLINAYIKNLKGDILAEEAARNEASTKIGKSNKEKEKLSQQITKAQGEFQKLIKKAVADRHHYEQTKIEIEEKLNIVKRLRDIVTDELVNEESKASTTKKSFIQIKTFNDILAELKSKVEKMEDKTLFAPLVDALVSLATSQHFSDQKILKKNLRCIRQIREQLKKIRCKIR